jgi:hypothetical protein
MARIAVQEPELAAALVPGQAAGTGGSQAAKEAVPWRAFLRNRPLQALAYTHFCNNWWVLMELVRQDHRMPRPLMELLGRRT